MTEPISEPSWIDLIVPPHGTVTGQYVAVSYDSADADSVPDVQPFTGRVILTPTTPMGRIDEALAHIRPVTVRIFGGQIVDDEDVPGVRILATDAEIGVEDWAWKAEILLDDGPKLKPFLFKLPTDETVSLSSGLVPVESAPYQLVQGAPGESAYEVAVRLGYTGTESEWLASLRGADGAAGAGKAYVDAMTAPLRVGANRYDPSGVTGGTLLTAAGALTASAAYDTSSLIPVVGGRTYSIWGVGAPGFQPTMGPRAWAFYDTKAAFVSYGGDGAQVPQTVTAPQDGFLRVSVRREVLPAPMVEQGPVTTYAPYTVKIPALDLGLATSDLPDRVVTPGKTSFVEEGRNLADRSAFKPDTFLANGEETSLAGYTTSGFIPVTGGDPYVGMVRMWAWYRADGSYISNVNAGSNGVVNTQNAPASAAFLRGAWLSTYDAAMQIERGTAASEFEPYGIRIPRLITQGGGGEPSATGPVSVMVAGDSLMVSSTVGSRQLTIAAALTGSQNGAFNLLSASLGGVRVSAGADEIAPLRTFNTVGANHGYACITTLRVGGHGKDRADLGSVWSDGTAEWTLLLIEGDALTLGPAYSISGEGVVTAPGGAPAGPLTHVSGATSTSDIPVGQVVDGAQLYPSVQRVTVTPLVDGRAVSDGEHHGVTAQVREVYEVLDYASIIDTAQANVGTPFHERRVQGAVRVESTYTFKPGLVLVDTALTELRPTSLGSCGFVQAIRPAGTGGRIVPGVTGWTTPRSFSETWTSQIITSSDLIDPAIPPVMSLDVMDWGGFALGYMPWRDGATSSQERIANGGSNLWDLRSTQKSYPSPWAAKAAGWGRVEAHAYRAYLTPAQADEVAAVADDAHAAHSALATVTGL